MSSKSVVVSIFYENLVSKKFANRNKHNFLVSIKCAKLTSIICLLVIQVVNERSITCLLVHRRLRVP